MMIRKADEETEAGLMPGQELLGAMAKYNEDLVNAGVMLAGDGLKPSSEGARVKFAAGKPTVVDGPFAESKELIAGYTIIDVKSRHEAIEWVRRWPPIDGHGNVEIELRQLYELSDFPAGEGLAHHVRNKDQLANM
ncbi:MAG: YciI family protein [Gemmatimonadaceae bacterium]